MPCKSLFSMHKTEKAGQRLVRKITVQDDLKSDRSKALLQKYDLNIGDIAPEFQKLYYYEHTHRRFDRKFEKFPMDGQILRDYEKGIASMLIVLYEKLATPRVLGLNFETSEKIPAIVELDCLELRTTGRFNYIHGSNRNNPVYQNRAILGRYEHMLDLLKLQSFLQEEFIGAH